MTLLHPFRDRHALRDTVARHDTQIRNALAMVDDIIDALDSGRLAAAVDQTGAGAGISDAVGIVIGQDYIASAFDHRDPGHGITKEQAFQIRREHKTCKAGREHCRIKAAALQLLADSGAIRIDTRRGIPR